MLFAAALRSPAARAAMRDKTTAITRTAIPPGEPVKPYPFALFYDLSRYLTLRVDLDRQLAHLHFENFRREEWGWMNAARIYAALRRDLDQGIVASAPEMLMRGGLDATERWFVQHMLDAWYEGFYRYEGAEIRVTYDKALMWDAVSDIVPVQGLSGAEYGYWSSAPKLREKE